MGVTNTWKCTDCGWKSSCKEEKNPGSFRNQQIYKRIQMNTIFALASHIKNCLINIQFTHKNSLINIQ
jgi:hypothetical protein